MLRLIFLVVTICSDSFAASAAICSAGIKIPLRSIFVISLTGAISFVLPIYFAEYLGAFIPEMLCRIISCILLLFLGAMNLFSKPIKSHQPIKKGCTNPIRLFFDGTAADADNSKILSAREAFFLSLALSADSFVTGISAGLSKLEIIPLAFLTLASGFVSVCAGVAAGSCISSAKDMNLQRICGIMLIILALWCVFQ